MTEYLKYIKNGKFIDNPYIFQLSDRGLFELPVLPNTIEVLLCSTNKLTKLPELSKTSLKKMECQLNKLVELPILPNTIIDLCCGYNKLIELPELHNVLEYLHCSNCNIAELPELPESIESLYCSCNNIKYLSPHNSNVIKNKLNRVQFRLVIINNPITDNFKSIEEFKESLSYSLSYSL
jgi:hypothetical protein